MRTQVFTIILFLVLPATLVACNLKIWNDTSKNRTGGPATLDALSGVLTETATNTPADTRPTLEPLEVKLPARIQSPVVHNSPSSQETGGQTVIDGRNPQTGGPVRQGNKTPVKFR